MDLPKVIRAISVDNRRRNGKPHPGTGRGIVTHGLKGLKIQRRYPLVKGAAVAGAAKASEAENPFGNPRMRIIPVETNRDY